MYIWFIPAIWICTQTLGNGDLEIEAVNVFLSKNTFHSLIHVWTLPWTLLTHIYIKHVAFLPVYRQLTVQGDRLSQSAVYYLNLFGISPGTPGIQRVVLYKESLYEVLVKKFWGLRINSVMMTFSAWTISRKKKRSWFFFFTYGNILKCVEEHPDYDFFSRLIPNTC